MKNIYIIIFAVFTISISNAQTHGCRCNTAIALGEVHEEYPWGVGSGPSWDGTTNWDTLVQNEIFDTIPEFSYLSMINCSDGYRKSISKSANALWYKLKKESAYLQLRFPSFNYLNSLDTLHVAIWKGNTCDSLTAVDCFTYAYKNTNAWFVLDVIDSTKGLFFLKITGDTIGKIGQVKFCIVSKHIAIPYTFNFPTYLASTDTTCMNYEILNSKSSLDSAHNGSALVRVIAG